MVKIVFLKELNGLNFTNFQNKVDNSVTGLSQHFLTLAKSLKLSWELN